MKSPKLGRTPFKVESFIVCDDVRAEISGKEILIGVYNKVAVFNTFPSVFAKVFFRIALAMEAVGKYSYVLNLEDEDSGKSLLQTASEVTVADIETDALLGFVIQNFVVEKPMKMLVKLELNGSSETVGRFSVRLPKTDEERKRVPN